MHTVTHLLQGYGRSILLKFNNISKCVNYIFQSASICHATQISLWKITIRRIHFYSVAGQIKKILVKPQQHTTTNISNSTGGNTSTPNNIKDTNQQSPLPLQNVSTMDEPLVISCEICSNKFAVEQELFAHMLVCQEKYIAKTTEKSTKMDISLYCSLCLKPMDNKHNLLKHQITCQKKQINTTGKKKLLQKKKYFTSEHYVKTTRHVQLSHQYDQIKSEVENLHQKRKQIEYKIKNRQHEISKLQIELEAENTKNEKNKLSVHLKKHIHAYLKTQISTRLKTQIGDLQSQITKLILFLKEMSCQEDALCSQQRDIQQQIDIVQDELNNVRLNYHQNKCSQFESNGNNHDKRKYLSTFSPLNEKTHVK